MVEFAYNKNLHASIGKGLFEVYGQDCLTTDILMCFNNLGIINQSNVKYDTTRARND